MMSGERTRSTGYKIGWWILFLLSGMSVLGYVSLILLESDIPADSLVAWATFSLYSVLVLLVPYRRLEPWAWYLTSVLVVPHVVLSLNDPAAATFYLPAAGLVAVSQLLIWPAFRRLKEGLGSSYQTTREDV